MVNSLLSFLLFFYFFFSFLSTTTLFPSSKISSSVVEACMPANGQNADISRFESTWVCVVQSGNVTWGNYQSFNRSAFEPQIDKYSRITYPNSWDPTLTSEEEIAISVQSMGVYGLQKMY